MMVTSVVWSVSNALEMMGLDLGTKLFWANVQNMLQYNPSDLMLLALEYTGKGRWLDLRRLLFPGDSNPSRSSSLDE